MMRNNPLYDENTNKFNAIERPNPNIDIKCVETFCTKISYHPNYQTPAYQVYKTILLLIINHNITIM